MIQYIVESIAFQLVFLIIYDFFLKRETFFQWNRVYLIGTYILSMVLPWIKIEAFKTTVPEQYYVYPEFLMQVDVTETVAVSDSFWWNISWESALLFGGMLLAATYFIYKLFQIYRLRKTGQVRYFPNFTRIVVANSQMAFSFFKSIFLGDKVLEKEHESIIQHELVHIEQKHTWDLLFFELMRVCGWFNPLVYVYQNRVSELHEFIADSKVAKTHKKEHYELLLSQVFQTENISFINQFFKSSLIKKRIDMLQKTKSRKVWQLKYLLLVPLVLGMLVYTSCEQETKSSEVLNESVKGDNTVIYKVMDLDALTEEEKLKRQELLQELFKSEKLSTLILEDQDMKSIKISAEKGIITKVEVDKVEIAKNKDYLLETTAKYNELVTERKRLLKSADEKNPIIVNLDKQLEALKSTMQKDMANSTIPFAVVDEPPIFPGCENATDFSECFKEKMRRHVVEHFQYPQEAQETGIQGKVYINFIIDEGGDVTNLRMRGPDTRLEGEARRIVDLLPKMKPGEHQGEVVGVQYAMPITFRLQDSPRAAVFMKRVEGKGMDISMAKVVKNGKRGVVGTVSDGENRLPGVNVQLESGVRETVTDFDGNYFIEAEKGQTLYFSYKNLPTTRLEIKE